MQRYDRGDALLNSVCIIKRTNRMDQKISLVTTLKHASKSVLESFITYHQSIGFDYIFLFFDDPEDARPYFKRLAEQEDTQ